MKKQKSILFLFSICFILISCDGGPKANTNPDSKLLPGEIVGNSADGKIYYETNCAGCHAAGVDDTSTAFGAVKDLMDSVDIKSNMTLPITLFGGKYNLMARFKNVNAQRVADLKAYMTSLKLN